MKMNSSNKPERRDVTGRRAALVFAFAAAAVVTGCRCDDDLRATTAGLGSDPAQVDFGGISAGQSRLLDIFLVSTGTGPVEIERMSIEGDSPGTFEIEEAPADGFVLGAGSTRAVLISFEPAEKIDYEAELVVHSTDPESPLRVPLSGSGLTPQIHLCLAPADDIMTGELDCAGHGEVIELDFGTVLQGRRAERVVGIFNGGEADLVIEGAEISDGTWENGFGVLASTGGAVLEPGASARLPLFFDGWEQGPAVGRLTFESNDREHPVVHVDLAGLGAVNAPPVACAGVSKIHHLDGTVEEPDPLVTGTIRGRLQDRFVFTAHPSEGCSRDEEDGTLLTYEWSLMEAPEAFDGSFKNPHSGPAVDLPEGMEPQNPPSLDITTVGVYRVQLIVFDSLGLASEPAEIEIDARPEEDLIVQLTWRQRADLDVHLIPPGALPFCELVCFWDTCRVGEEGEPGLFWGAVPAADDPSFMVIGDDGDPETDPLLAFDNGGETTVRDSPDLRLETIAVPLLVAVDESLGPYEVGVHYFYAPRDSSGEIELQEPVEATVEVISRGEVLYETTHSFAPDDEGVFWTAGVVTLDGDDIVGAPVEGETIVVPDYVGPPGPCE